MVDKTQGPVNTRDELLKLLHTENDRISKQLTELQSLIDQTHNEVERLQQKNAMVTNRLHQIESNFDSVPRQDIRVAYNEAMDTRNRLLTMRGNLEKLQSDQRQLDQMSKIIRQCLARWRASPPAPSPARTRAARSRSARRQSTSFASSKPRKSNASAWPARCTMGRPNP
jgi:chromosome segregation ATPase